MSVYNRKSWIHNGTKHWIHNGRHYHKRLGFFGTKKKFKRKYNEKKIINKIRKKYNPVDVLSYDIGGKLQWTSYK